jgi:hypothetical protein
MSLAKQSISGSYVALKQYAQPCSYVLTTIPSLAMPTQTQTKLSAKAWLRRLSKAVETEGAGDTPDVMHVASMEENAWIPSAVELFGEEAPTTAPDSAFTSASNAMDCVTLAGLAVHVSDSPLNSVSSKRVQVLAHRLAASEIGPPVVASFSTATSTFVVTPSLSVTLAQRAQELDTDSQKHAFASAVTQCLRLLRKTVDNQSLVTSVSVDNVAFFTILSESEDDGELVETGYSCGDHLKGVPRLCIDQKDTIVLNKEEIVHGHEAYNRMASKFLCSFEGIGDGTAARLAQNAAAGLGTVGEALEPDDLAEDFETLRVSSPDNADSALMSLMAKKNPQLATSLAR